MAVSNTLAKSNQKLGMTAYLSQTAVRDQINKIIGGQNGTRFITSIVSAVNANEQLQQCTNQSILSAALLGESLNLSPSPMLGYYYMVPFNDKNKGKVAQFQIGYKGLIQLAIRSGQYKKINVMSIKKGELEYFDPLNEEIKVKLMVDNWDAREKAETIGYYAMFELVNGFKKAIYWSKEQMEAHALQYSQGYRAKKGYTFWEKDFDAMAHKTLLRQILSKWGIMSTELQAAVEADEAVIEEDGSKTYVDNEEIIDVPETKPAPAAAPAKEETPAEDPAAALFGGN
jgi:recombination protein RecT